MGRRFSNTVWCSVAAFAVAPVPVSSAATKLSAALLNTPAIQRQTLDPHHVPPVLAHMGPVADLPGSTRLNLAVGLPLRSPTELDTLLLQLYDPTSPNYHRYLAPEEFTARFGPTEADYQLVTEFMKANGLSVTVTHPNRMVLDVVGSAADIERTFHINLRVYRHPSEVRTFFAPDVEPSLNMAVPILHISGLDDYFIPRPNLKLRLVGSTDTATPNAGSGPAGTYRGRDFRTAYVPGTTLTGIGQSVGLLQFDGFFPGDITNYESQAGLPNVPLTIVPVAGGISTPGSGNIEVALDIEMVISMAPGLSRIYVYEAPNSTAYWVDLLSRMANDNLAKQLSCSWSGGFANATAEQIFKQMAVQGQSFFNATGDSDAFTGLIPFPSDSTNITEVGGTTLTTGSGSSYSSETVWNWGKQSSGNYAGSSGGVSTYYPIPSYQQAISMVTNQGSVTMRNVPDVALTADNVCVVYNNGSVGIIGGTSCAAPLWAGFTALINQQAAATSRAPVGFLNPAIYAIGKGSSYTNAFHDTKTGNNFSKNSPTNFPAVAGYDLCTGWGTPNGTNLINALVPLPVSLTGTVAYYPPTYPTNGLSTNRVGNVAMNLTGGPSLLALTLAAGSYGLSNIPGGGTYALNPSKTTDISPANGITVADLAMIQAQVLGKLALGPYQLLAADVNTNGSVTASDLALIQAVILGKATNFPAGLWRFVPADYVFLDPLNPWSAPGQRWYTNRITDVTNGDFVAIKLGDVNGSWKAQVAGPNIEFKSPEKASVAATKVPAVGFALEEQRAQPGQMVTVAVAVSGFREVTSAQFTLGWDPKVLHYVGTDSYGLKGLSAGSFNTTLSEKGELAFAWYDAEAAGAALAEGTVLFSVSFEVIGQVGSISPVILTGAPTPEEVSVDFGLASFAAKNGSVAVVGPGVLVHQPGYVMGLFQLSVTTEKGHLYRLEFADTLAPARWTALPAVQGNGTVTVLKDLAATNQQRFYRLRVD
jgi:hypothetical protein